MRRLALVALFLLASERVDAQATGAIDGSILRGDREGSVAAAAAGAEVRLFAVELAMMDSAFTSRFPPQRATDSGTFAFRGLEAGSYRLSVRLVGYVSAVVDVSVAEGETARARVVLEPLSPRLAQVVTTANRTRVAQTLEKSGFTERRRIGWGHFIGPEQLTRTGSMTVLSELKPWLRGCMIMYLDGAPAAIPPTLQPRDVAGIEIYSRNLQAPAAYQSARSDCGSILIWLAPPDAGSDAR